VVVGILQGNFCPFQPLGPRAGVEGCKQPQVPWQVSQDLAVDMDQTGRGQGGALAVLQVKQTGCRQLQQLRQQQHPWWWGWRRWYTCTPLQGAAYAWVGLLLLLVATAAVA